MLTLVPRSEPEPMPLPSAAVTSNCPQCAADLAVLRIIPGKGGAEYWTMRCTKCGGIHLDIVKDATAVKAGPDSGDLRA